MDEDHLPALFREPLLTLRQLTELFMNEDSPHVSEEDEKHRLALTVLSQRVAIGKTMGVNGLGDGRGHQEWGRGARVAAAMAWPCRFSCSFGVCISVRSARSGNSL